MLADFDVVESRKAEDDPVITCKDGRQLVLVRIDPEAWGDVLKLTADQLKQFDIAGANLLARSNLEELKPFIQQLYDARAYEMVGRMGGSYPQITITYSLLSQIGDKLNGNVLALRHQAGFRPRQA